MPLTTRCPHCQTVLNIPPEAEGRRLRCPKCGEKFHAGPSSGGHPASSSRQSAEASPSSTGMLAPVPNLSDEAMPVAAGDLRETFDLPLLMDDGPSRPPGRHESGDAASLLFREDEPASRRRPTGAAARAQPRRCRCGGVVPAGMSLCQRCGTDLDTGRREMMDELLDEAPPPIVRSPGPPIGLVVIGSAALLASGMLAILALAKLEGVGRWSLGAVCLFGVYAAVQFLRGKSARPLMVALMLGGAIDVVALIGLPVYHGFVEVPAADPDGDEPQFRPYAERVDMDTITWGIVVLLIDAGAFVYLSTGGVRRHFDRPRPPGLPPL